MCRQDNEYRTNVLVNVHANRPFDSLTLPGGSGSYRMRHLHASPRSQETGHDADRFTCTVTTADEPSCQSYARVTIIDAEGTTARGCPRHVLAALSGITGAHVDWPDSKGLNQWERKALELAEERSQLG
jgi:hypothetical protein